VSLLQRREIRADISEHGKRLESPVTSELVAIRSRPNSQDSRCWSWQDPTSYGQKSRA